MKERPILFSGPMVRAILEGRKTQTRRVIKPQPVKVRQAFRFKNGVYPVPEKLFVEYLANYRCPHGRLGDRLWVRETHAIVPRTAYAQSTGVQQVLRPDDNHDAAIFREGWDRSPPGRWRPSIHMPRWASRITLEITGVRVERLRDISEEDAKAEGCWYGAGGRQPDPAVSPEDHFPTLWESINGAGSWDANPWVWVVEFDRVEVQ